MMLARLSMMLACKIVGSVRGQTSCSSRLETKPVQLIGASASASTREAPAASNTGVSKPCHRTSNRPHLDSCFS